MNFLNIRRSGFFLSVNLDLVRTISIVPDKNTITLYYLDNTYDVLSLDENLKKQLLKLGLFEIEDKK